MTDKDREESEKTINSADARPKVEFIAMSESLEYGPALDPPFYGTSSVLRWEGAEILSAIDTNRLFTFFWGGLNSDAAACAQAEKTDYASAFRRLIDEMEKDALLDPAAMYGYFPVITENEKIILLDPGDFHTELAEFVFPRIPQDGNRSIADYLRPGGDLLAVQAVTLGSRLSGRAREYLANENSRQLGTYLNGIGACLTVQLAGRVTLELRRGLGLPEGAGKRYAFGQPGMPDANAQPRLMEIMAIEERLGIIVTKDFALLPETSALEIFIHHITIKS